MASRIPDERLATAMRKCAVRRLGRGRQSRPIGTTDGDRTTPQLRANLAAGFATRLEISLNIVDLISCPKNLSDLACFIEVANLGDHDFWSETAGR